MSSVDIALPGRPRERHLPGEAGIWIFILGDLLIFGLFFLVFMTYRIDQAALYAQSRAALSQAYGLTNTLLLLTSSWFVALAVHGARAGRRTTVLGLFASAFSCGVGFVFIKALEYGALIRDGITITTNDFYMFYFMFTGIHLVHVAIGLGVLGYLTASWRGAPHHSTIARLESGSVFWHLVDLLWIVLFALLYLLT